jgi:hypothetical protein
MVGATNAPRPASPSSVTNHADSDSVVPGRVEQLVILPLPAPAAIRPVEINACFDVEANGRTALITWTRTADTTYNNKVEQSLRGYRFRPSRRLSGAAVRDTICIRAITGK